jgi:L-ectoine synthase
VLPVFSGGILSHIPEINMIVRNLQDCENSERSIDGGTWKSVRMLLAEDNMGFSFHITTIYAGTETPIWYKNHLESVFCISGDGEIETCADGKVYPIKAGTLYILDQHDKHLLRGGSTDMVMACVFNPPLNGREIHDEDGSYRLNDATLSQ